MRKLFSQQYLLVSSFEAVHVKPDTQLGATIHVSEALHPASALANSIGYQLWSSTQLSHALSRARNILETSQSLISDTRHGQQ